MHVARPLISPVTDASPESPWSTDNKVCVLREMTNEGPRGEEENRKEDEDQKTAGPESCREFQKLTHEGEEPEIVPEPCRIYLSTLNGQMAISTAKERACPGLSPFGKATILKRGALRPTSHQVEQ